MISGIQKCDRNFLTFAKGAIAILLFCSSNAYANCLLSGKTPNLDCARYDFGLPVTVTNNVSEAENTLDHAGVNTNTIVNSTIGYPGTISGSISRVSTGASQVGLVNAFYGSVNDVFHTGAGIVRYATALQAGIHNQSTGSMTTATGIQVPAPENSGGGTIEKYYGIYIATPTAATENYAFYSQGGLNFFGGKILATEICDENGYNCKTIASGWGSSGGGTGNGTVTSISAGAGLTGGTITDSGTIAVDYGTTANKIVRLNSQAELPAVSAKNLTDVNATQLAGNTISISSSNTNDVLTFDGSYWTNKALSSSDISDLSTIIGSKLDAANMPASCYANQTLTFSSPTGMWACSDIVVTPSVFGTQDAGFVMAAPDSTSGAPTFRKLTLADLPSGIGGGGWTENNGDIYRVDGNVSLGTDFPEAKLTVVNHPLSPGSDQYGNYSVTALNVTGDYSENNIVGVYGRTTAANGQTYNYGNVYGVIGETDFRGDGTASNAIAVSAQIVNRGNHQISNAYGFLSFNPQNRAGGQIDNYYGVYIYNPTGAVNNYSIYSEGGYNFLGGDLEVATKILADQICDRNGNNCKDVTTGWSSGGGGGGGSLTSITAGTGLTGGTITDSGTIAVDVGTGASQIVQLDSYGALPAVSGANLTSVNATKLSGYDVTASPSPGDFLRFDGSSWSNKSLEVSDIAGLSTQMGNKIDAASMPPSCYANQTLTYMSPTGMWSCTYIAITPEVFGTQGQGMVLAAPDSSNGTATFRKLTLADLPSGIGGGSSWPEQDGNTYRQTGMVGIGTNTPDSKLTVSGSTQEFVSTNQIVANFSGTSDSPVQSITAVQAQVNNSNSTAPAYAYGVSVKSPVFSSAPANYYGLYIGSSSATANNYAIYTEGSAQVRIGGEVKISGQLKVNEICDRNGSNCKNITGGWGIMSIEENKKLHEKLESMEKQNTLLKNRLDEQAKILSQIQTQLSQKVAKAR